MRHLIQSAKYYVIGFIVLAAIGCFLFFTAKAIADIEPRCYQSQHRFDGVIC